MMQQRHTWFTIGALLAISTFLLCTFDDSTGLGSAIINDVDPDKVNLDKHFREYLLGTSALDTYASLPRAGDQGFGVHDVSGSGNVMVIGRKGSEYSAGLVRFLCTADTNFGKTGGRLFYHDDDSLVSIKILFSRTVRDSLGGPCKMKIFSTPGEYAFDTAGSPLDTLAFSDTALADSVLLPPGDLCNAIFTSCRSMDTNYTGDTFNFGLMNISRDTLYRLHSNIPNLKVSIRRKVAGKNDTILSKAYAVTKAFYIGFEDQPGDLAPLPVVSYASHRTAVFSFDAAGLWAAVNDTAPGTINNLVSGNIILPCPAKDSTKLFVKCIVSKEMISEARTLDSLFNQTATGSITDTLHTIVFNKRKELQIIARERPQPEKLYLFFRLDCDRSSSLSVANKEQWQTALLDEPPFLTTILHIP